MGSALNADCFEEPNKAGRYMLSARGQQTSSAGGSSNGGMTKMNRVHLTPGQNYYRFCDLGKFTQDWKRAAGGPWWIEFETFETIRAFASKHEHVRDFARSIGQSGLGYAAKLHLAVPYEWGDCGAIICARLVNRLDAWKGWGGIATLSVNNPDPRDGGAKYIPLQKPDVFQLYIPEMSTYFEAAFAVVRAGEVAAFE